MILHSNPKIRCPDCGSISMICEEVDSYESTSEPNVFVKDSLYIRLRCAVCGAVALKIDANNDRRKISLRG